MQLEMFNHSSVHRPTMRNGVSWLVPAPTREEENEIVQPLECAWTNLAN